MATNNGKCDRYGIQGSDQLWSREPSCKLGEAKVRPGFRARSVAQAPDISEFYIGRLRCLDKRHKIVRQSMVWNARSEDVAPGADGARPGGTSAVLSPAAEDPKIFVWDEKR